MSIPRRSAECSIWKPKKILKMIGLKTKTTSGLMKRKRNGQTMRMRNSKMKRSGE